MFGIQWQLTDLLQPHLKWNVHKILHFMCMVPMVSDTTQEKLRERRSIVIKLIKVNKLNPCGEKGPIYIYIHPPHNCGCCRGKIENNHGCTLYFIYETVFVYVFLLLLLLITFVMSLLICNRILDLWFQHSFYSFLLHLFWPS